MRHMIHSLVLTMFAAACGSNGSSPVLATTTIGPAGGVVEVTEGEIAGAKVVIPPGALDRPTQIGISPLLSPAVPGFVTLGPGVTFEPLGLEFKVPVTITLPFDPALLLANVATVLSQGQATSPIELAPATLPSPGMATVDVASFSTAFAAERFLGGVETVEFMPLQSGNEWNFENGIKITAQFSFAEPNLGGAPVIVLLVETAAQNVGFYLRQTAGVTQLLGTFQTTGGEDYQQLHDPTVFLPLGVTIGRPVQAAFAYTRYEPYGATSPTSSGLAQMGLLTEVANDVTTAVGNFEDVFEFTYAATFKSAGGQVYTLPFSLTLANEVGPVAIEILGFETVLESGTVDGDEIEGLQSEPR